MRVASMKALSEWISCATAGSRMLFGAAFFAGCGFLDSNPSDVTSGEWKGRFRPEPMPTSSTSPRSFGIHVGRSRAVSRFCVVEVYEAGQDVIRLQSHILVFGFLTKPRTKGLLVQCTSHLRDDGIPSPSGVSYSPVNHVARNNPCRTML